MSSFLDLLPMYKGINGSPVTTLMKQYNTAENDTSITVRDGSSLPEAPNICTIYTSAGTNSGVAVVHYESKDNNELTGLNVEYKNTEEEILFPVGTFVSRKYAEEDHNAFKTNIEILADITQALVDYVQPTPSIATFTIPDLPETMPIGSSYTGNHTLTHRELLMQFIDGDMDLYEQDKHILSFNPSLVDTDVEFEANLHFDKQGDYVYRLQCKDVNGNIISKNIVTTVLTNTLYFGHSLSDTMTSSILDTFTVSSECYDGMIAKITANNDYVWFCIAQPCEVLEVSSYGFTVPTESAQVVTKQIGTHTVNFNCYRTTARVIAGYENKFKLSLKLGEE